jgi:hypothetical protein
MAEKVYLGDGVYTEFDTVIIGDVTLTAGSVNDPTNRIYMEPHIVDAMLKLRQRAKEGN